MQIPAFYAKCGTVDELHDCDPHKENKWAMFGLIYCVVAFLGYLFYAFVSTPVDRSQVILKALEYKEITFFECITSGLIKVDDVIASLHPAAKFLLHLLIAIVTLHRRLKELSRGGISAGPLSPVRRQSLTR